MAGRALSLFLVSPPSTAAKAAELTQALKSHGIDCWTGSLAAGGQLATEALAKLRNASGVVLLFDRVAAASRDVDRHLLVARQEGKVLIPVRLEQVDEGLLRQELLDAQWIDGNSPAAPAEIAARAYRAAVARPNTSNASASVAMPVPAKAEARSILLGATAVILLGILAVLLFLAFRPDTPPEGTGSVATDTKASKSPALEPTSRDQTAEAPVSSNASGAQAGPQATPSPDPTAIASEASASGTVWNHNGSTLALSSDGTSRTFSYLRPASGVPARPGDIVFTGTRTGQRYHGTAYLFSRRCGRIGYSVAGDVAPDEPRVVLYGQAPRRHRETCEITGYSRDRLVFDYLHR